MRRRWLGILLLAPLLSGCASGSTTTATATPAASTTPWSVLAAGSPTPSPTPSRAAGTPYVFPTGFLPLGSTAPAVTPTPSGDGCDPVFSRHEINGVTATTTATTGTVTWWNPGGNNLVEYRVTAISQDLQNGQQRDVGWTVVTPGNACGYLSATVTGLDRKTHYVFSIDAVTTITDQDGTRAATIARTLPTSTL